MKLSELEAWCRERREFMGRDCAVLVEPLDPRTTDYIQFRGTQNTTDLQEDEVYVLLEALPW
jgi:hypothetical protein